MLGSASVSLTVRGCQILVFKGSRKILICIGLAGMLASCTGSDARSQDPEPVVVSPVAFMPYPLKIALNDLTGFSLGAQLKDYKRSNIIFCAPKIRYGDQVSSKVAQLFCADTASRDLSKVKYWVNFTAPVKGHKIWKIRVFLKGENRQSRKELFAQLSQRYGKPRVVDKPLSYSWQNGSTFLTIIEDDYGLQFELWDRGMHVLS